MFEDGDFYLDDDELAEENQMTLVEDAIVKCLDAMERSMKELRNNLIFQEKQDQASSLRILAMHLDSAIKLATIDENNLSEEEVFEEIEKVMKQATELTFANMNYILPQPEEDEDMGTTPPALTSGDTDNSTDW